MIADTGSTYLDANASICRMLGYSREELIGMHASDIVIQAEVPQIAVALGAITARAPYEREWQFRRKDGTTFPAEVIATTMPDGNLLGMIRDISLRKQSEETLRLRERALAEISQGVIISDESRLITYANASFTAITGYTEAEVLRRSCSFLQGNETDAATIAEMRAAVHAGKFFEGEILNYRKDGTPFWNDLSIAPIHPLHGEPLRFIGIQRDITERKEAQQTLRRALDRLQLSVKAGRIGTWDFDLLTGEVDWDEQMLILYGMKADAVEPGTLRWERSIHPEDLARTTAIYDAALRDGESSFETEFRIRRGNDGSERFIRGMGLILRNENGDSMRMMGINWDITEGRLREEQLASALAQEKELSEKAREGVRAKSEFLAVMSHEIRTPLNGILGFSELLARTPNLPAESRDYAQTITSSGQALLRILDDVLDFSRLEAGRLELEKAFFQPRQILEDIHTLLGQPAKEKDLNFKVLIAENIPTSLEGDAGRLRQILLNLGGNALKFTQRGSVTLELRRLADTEHYEFAVKDTGPGITPEQLECVFQPFTQGDSSISRRHGGSGMGLSISRRLAELMGGSLEVRSTLGQGSEFILTVPLGNKTSAPIEDPIESSQKFDPDFSSQHPLKILVVEDDKVNLKLITMLLRRLGYECMTAKNGREVVDMQQANHADCILMDLQMPEMDGIEATAHIRAWEKSSEENHPAFIAALTANISSVDRQRCFDAGMDRYLNKPVQLSALAAVLAEAAASR